MSLEEYLSGQYVRDVQNLDAIEVLLVEVAETLSQTFDSSSEQWPYQISAPKPDKSTLPLKDSAPDASNGISHTNTLLSTGTVPNEGEATIGAERVLSHSFSPGTASMLLTSVAKFVDLYDEPSGKRSNKLKKLDQSKCQALERAFKSARNRLAKHLTTEGVTSITFGDNNPVTISQVLEFTASHSYDEARNETSRMALGDIVRDKTKALVDDWYTKFQSAGRIDIELPKKPEGYSWSAESSFLVLRLLKSKNWLEKENSDFVVDQRFRTFFEARLHEQLSFSSIPDSRFDPAELAFSLEGLLLCSKEAVDPILMKRVLEVLQATQGTTAYWRPNRPFFYKDTGPMVLPLSVEGANSLLRSVEALDRKKLHDTCTALAIPMFRRFFEWLRARKTILNHPTYKRCVGWQSEHINTCDVIHLWDTSQIVEFLWAFRSLLQDHIARETLLLSGLKVEHPKLKTEDKPKSFTERWKSVSNTYEPIAKNPHIAKIFDQIGRDFIAPLELRDKPETLCYSMLVYGPPGTGKTTIAENIAAVLERRFITVTVSDFLGSGGAQVEARAKAIFQSLQAQQDCVILFDEIDAFLLNRTSTYYFEQDSLFQFLTPGMLTKINDLHSVKRSIFIIATNYENRIDPAIKRPGRIDQSYLLLPPDQTKREEMIRTFAEKIFSPEIWNARDVDKNGSTERLSSEEPQNAPNDRSSTITKWAQKACFLGYKQIEGVLSDVAGKLKADPGIKGDLEELIATALKKKPRSARLEDYLSEKAEEHRTNSGRPAPFPDFEFSNMIRLADEAGFGIETQWKDLSDDLRDKLKRLMRDEDIKDSVTLKALIPTE